MTEHTLIRPAARVVAITAALLAIPLLAMQFTDEVMWSPADFLFAALMFIGVGMAYVLVTRAASDPNYRVAVASALGTAFLLVWSNLAVGIIGSESNPANAMYAGVLAVAIVGAAFARFRAAKMVYVMSATALAQTVVATVAMLGRLGLPDSGAAEIFAINAFFVTLWLVAAALFRRAASPER